MKKTIVLSILCAFFFLNCNNDDEGSSLMLPENLPNVSDATFSNPTNITNNYYGPAAGKTYIYAGGEINMEPEEEIIIERRATTKEVMGITCIIQNDRVYLDGILIEDTDDWLAQDDNGNLWYLGEFVKNYDDLGNFTDNDGSWEAGVDGAFPGYWIPVNPMVGQKYHQEYYKGEAEDQAEILALGQTITIEMGTFDNCIVTKDFTLLEMTEFEKKYFAPGIGLIKEEKFINNELVEVVELTDIME